MLGPVCTGICDVLINSPTTLYVCVVLVALSAQECVTQASCASLFLGVTVKRWTGMVERWNGGSSQQSERRVSLQPHSRWGGSAHTGTTRRPAKNGSHLPSHWYEATVALHVSDTRDTTVVR